MITRITFTNSC